MNEVLQLSGFDEIEEFEKGKVKENALRFIEKNERELKNIEFLKIHLKECCETGKRKKYFIHSMLAFSGTQLASKAEEWNLTKAVDESLKRIEKELEHWIKKNKIKK